MEPVSSPDEQPFAYMSVRPVEERLCRLDELLCMEPALRRSKEQIVFLFGHHFADSVWNLSRSLFGHHFADLIWNLLCLRLHSMRQVRYGICCTTSLATMRVTVTGTVLTTTSGT